ncbi:hypothetical protein ACFLRU_07205, partial [Bacteroidota bacterium]
FELELKNTGLADFEVYGYTVENAGNNEIYADPLIVKPSDFGKAKFTYTPTSEGVINDKLVLNTNLGDLAFSLRIISEKEPSMALNSSSSNITVNYGNTEPLTLTIANDGTGAALDYDLSHYSLENKTSGLLTKKLNYSISSSLDQGGPIANTWEDISSFGTHLKIEVYGASSKTGMKFPFFDQLLTSLNIDKLGSIDVYNYKAMTPLIIEGEPLNIKDITYHAFGDRTVFSFDCNIMKTGSKGFDNYGETVTYQIVLFKDGTIEYRYKDVSDLTSEKDYQIFLQGLKSTDTYVFRDYGDALQISNGLVVRFTPNRAVSMVGEANKLEGTILSGNSETVSLNIDPKTFEFAEGTYKDTIVVYNNTANKFNTIPLTINVLGETDVVVIDSLNFIEPVFLGQEDTKYLKIENNGAQAINLVSASVNLSQFTIDNSMFPLEVKGISNIMLPVKFKPTNTNQLLGEISVSFEDGALYKAVITAEGSEDSEYTQDLAFPIAVNLAGGEKTSIPFNITNTSSTVALEYVFKNSKYSWVSNDEIGKAIGENNKDIITDYGYSWTLSDSSKTFHKWDVLNLQEGRLEIEANEYESIELPFEFPFYGAKYNTIWISPNGYISVQEPKNQPQSPEFILEDDFNGIIAPLWANLKINENGDGLNYKIQDNKLIVQWYKLKGQNSSTDPGTISFQVEIDAEGTIKYHYGEIESWGGLLKYGLKSTDGTEYLEEPKSQIMLWANIKNNSSIIITPPQRGSIAAQQQDAFNLTISAEDIFYPGTYQDTLTLVSNSKNQKTLEIPVSLTVTGSPVLAATDTIAWDETIFRDNLTLRKPISLTNKGYDVLKITTIYSEGLEGVTLYDEDENKIIRNSSGVLLNSIDINPWETQTIYTEISVPEHQNQLGKIYFSGNFTNTETVVKATIVDSPIFNWDAQDQEYTLTNIEDKVYTFNIENKGETKLNYILTPATVANVDPTPGELYISDNISEYEFEDRVTVDSLALDTKEIGDGVFTPWTSGVDLAFSNKFTAPKGGFNLTHIKSYSYFDKIEELITIMVYKGGDLPQDGEKIYEQQYLINTKVNEEWIYFPLEKPFFIPEGEEFYIIMTHPVSSKYLGFDNSNDVDILQHCFTGVYQGNQNYYWYPGYTQSEFMIWKMRPVTASGKNQWLTIDNKEGVIPAGSSIAVNATINPKIAGKGAHTGKIIVKSNDINNSKEEVTITLNVNGTPEFEFYPNIYKDTLKIKETESKIFSYLFEDVEQEEMTISIDESIKGLEYELTQTGQKTAQVSVNTDYESEGYYKIPVSLKDAVGNITMDTISIQVLEKNRAPIFNVKYEVITLNMASDTKAITINPFDLFSDPDNDAIQILAGNYNPEIVDMALGSSFVNLNPLKVGTGQLVFGADDGKEDGFVIYLVYVNVIDDSNAASGVPDGNATKVNFDGLDIPAIFSPNPVINNTAKLYYKLEDVSNVNIQLFNSFGQL